MLQWRARAPHYSFCAYLFIPSILQNIYPVTWSSTAECLRFYRKAVYCVLLGRMFSASSAWIMLWWASPAYNGEIFYDGRLFCYSGIASTRWSPRASQYTHQVCNIIVLLCSPDNAAGADSWYHHNMIPCNCRYDPFSIFLHWCCHTRQHVLQKSVWRLSAITTRSICLERGIFKKHGIDVTFRLVPEGTGAMLSLLEAGMTMHSDCYSLASSIQIEIIQYDSSSIWQNIGFSNFVPPNFMSTLPS